MTQGDALERVVAQLLKSATVGSLRVVDADASVSTGSDGDPILLFQIRITDPPADSETWPTDDVHKLYRRVLSLVLENDLDIPPVVELLPEHPETPAPRAPRSSG